MAEEQKIEDVPTGWRVTKVYPYVGDPKTHSPQDIVWRAVLERIPKPKRRFVVVSHAMIPEGHVVKRVVCITETQGLEFTQTLPYQIQEHEQDA